MELSDEEFKAYLQMKQVDQLNEQDKKLKTIKNILVFWLILSMIPLAVSLFALIFR